MKYPYWLLTLGVILAIIGVLVDVPPVCIAGLAVLGVVYGVVGTIRWFKKHS